MIANSVNLLICHWYNSATIIHFCYKYLWTLHHYLSCSFFFNVSPSGILHFVKISSLPSSMQGFSTGDLWNLKVWDLDWRKYKRHKKKSFFLKLNMPQNASSSATTLVMKLKFINELFFLQGTDHTEVSANRIIFIQCSIRQGSTRTSDYIWVPPVFKNKGWERLFYKFWWAKRKRQPLGLDWPHLAKIVPQLCVVFLKPKYTAWINVIPWRSRLLRRMFVVYHGHWTC